jgi:phosphatidylglycerol:prolipoprotein diacylglycerol transferase
MVHDPLKPIAIQLGPIQVHWYAIIIVFAILVGYGLAGLECRRQRIDQDVLDRFLFIVVPVAILCARMYYVVFHWKDYAGHPADIPAIWKGGLAIHGALIGSLIVTVIFTRAMRLSFWRWADVLAPNLILGQAIGRWGNFMNQEAHGGPVSRAFLEHLHLPDLIINHMYIHGQYYAPTFLYESVWDFLGFVLLLLLKRLPLKSGERFLGYLLWYSSGRYVIEGMRTDSLMLTSSIKMAQVVSVVAIAAGLLIVIYRRLRPEEKSEKL